ncbi:hypothetical protein HELRODRAFT_176730 [Helobdella robusta]|uniref:Nipped-B protein n=1 Tax=Helobdella robusta TaxID=6412 RepID=T1FAU5_HELRO|nr:hypothetical protein HELRODRAFT_176730 [Helobdella robusta]ESN99562.1 hypothetical protein HELRODRAFT_176730 [Helobdella robusta]
MADSTASSQMAQLFLKPLLNCFTDRSSIVRTLSLDIIISTLHLGLTHPALCLPYLLSSCTSVDDANTSSKAYKWLLHLHKRYPQFVQASMLMGLRLSYNMHHNTSKAEETSNINQRHSFFLSALKLFDGSYHHTTKAAENIQGVEIKELLFIADNMASFAYQRLEEITKNRNFSNNPPNDILVSKKNDKSRKIKQNNTKKKIKSMNINNQDDGEDDNECEMKLIKENCSTFVKSLPETEANRLRHQVHQIQGCLLLVYLRDHLKKLYDISDGLVQEFSRAGNAKTFDKLIQKKSNLLLKPKLVLLHIDGPQDEQFMVDTFMEIQKSLTINDMCMNLDC